MPRVARGQEVELPSEAIPGSCGPCYRTHTNTPATPRVSTSSHTAPRVILRDTLRAPLRSPIAATPPSPTPSWTSPIEARIFEPFPLSREGPNPLPASSRDAVECYLSRLAESSRVSALSGLRTVARILAGDPKADPAEYPWAELDHAALVRLRRALARHHRPETANLRLAYVRGVLREAWRLALLDRDAMERIIDVGRVRGVSPPRGRHVRQDEIAAMLAACPDTTRGRRDAAVLQLLYQAGLRRGEAVGLDVRAWEDAEIRVRRGKGQKFRVVPVNAALDAALRRWLEARRRRAGALLCRVDARDRIVSRQALQPAAIGQIVSILVERSGVDMLTPHDLRRSFVSELLDRGADLAIVQQLVGHSGPATTSRYDRRGAPARRRAVELLEA